MSRPRQSWTTGQAFPDHPQFGPFVGEFALYGEAEVSSGVPQDIWGFTGFVDFTKTGVVTVVSDNAADNPSSTGAGSVLIVGSNSSTNAFQLEFLNLNGLTPVVGSLSFKNPIAAMGVAAAGSGGDPLGIPVAAGNITATIDGSNSSIIRTDLDHNQSHTGALHGALTPAGDAGTTVVRTVTIEVAPVSPGVGEVEIDVFLANSAAGPFSRVGPTAILDTAVASQRTIRVFFAAVTGSIFLSRVTSVTRDCRVSVVFPSLTYGPPP